MNITGLGGFDPYIYNRYNINEAGVSNVEPKVEDENLLASEVSNEHERVEVVNASIEDIKSTFANTRGRDLNLISATSIKDDIDVDKAVSDIRRDKVLGQYRYFVGSEEMKSEDGTVRRKL